MWVTIALQESNLVIHCATRNFEVKELNLGFDMQFNKLRKQRKTYTSIISGR